MDPKGKLTLPQFGMQPVQCSHPSPLPISRAKLARRDEAHRAVLSSCTRKGSWGTSQGSVAFKMSAWSYHTGEGMPLLGLATPRCFLSPK